MPNLAETKRSNRRVAPRSKPRGYVKLECRKGSFGFGANLATVLMDVSETGARIVINQELPAKQEVEIMFTGYGMSRTVKRLANLRWQLKLEDGKFCIGVEFDKRLEYRDLQTLASPN